jgi:hypothetical protein
MSRRDLDEMLGALRGSLIHDDVAYGSVIVTQMYASGMGGRIKRLLFSLFFSATFTTDRVEDRGDLLIVYSGGRRGRSDHEAMVARLRRIVGAADHTFLEVGERFSLRQPYRTLFHLRKFISTDGLGSLGWRYWTALLLAAKYHSFVSRIEDIVQPHSGVVVFCDAHPWDNAIAQVAAKFQRRSFTVQHGQYREPASRPSPDAEAYLNFVSDRMFVWGDATVREFSRLSIPADRLVVTGWIREWEDETLRSPLSVSGVFGVILNGANSSTVNELLLSWAEELAVALDMEILVRLHPSAHRELYESVCGPRVRKLDYFAEIDWQFQVEFSVGHASGAIVECLRRRHAIYLPDVALPQVFRVSGLAFSTVLEMIEQIQLDRSSPAVCRERLGRLYRDFNDDSMQETTIRRALGLAARED